MNGRFGQPSRPACFGLVNPARLGFTVLLGIPYTRVGSQMCSTVWVHATFAPVHSARPSPLAFLMPQRHCALLQVFTEAELKLVARLCVEHDVICLCDEVYEHLVFGGKQHVSPRSLPGMKVSACSGCGTPSVWVRALLPVGLRRHTPHVRMPTAYTTAA